MSLKNFVNDWKILVRLCNEDPNQKVHGFGYGGINTTASHLREIMREKLHNKISRGDPRNVSYWQSKADYESIVSKRGYYSNTDRPTFHFKKYVDDSYLLRFSRDRDRLSQIRNRIRVYQFETKYFRDNFGSLLASQDD